MGCYIQEQNWYEYLFKISIPSSQNFALWDTRKQLEAFSVYDLPSLFIISIEDLG